MAPLLWCLVAFFASVATTPTALACNGDPCPTDIDLFREATEIYEVTAVPSERYRFQVDKTWRGQSRPFVELRIWSFFMDQCGCQSSIVAGEEYLLLLKCGEQPEPAVELLNCAAYAEPMAYAERRVKVLAKHLSLSRDTLISELEAWNQGQLSTEDFSAWIEEQHLVAVEDWQPKFEHCRPADGFDTESRCFRSATVSALDGLSRVLGLRSWQCCVNSFPEIVEALREVVTPALIESLAQPGPTDMRLFYELTDQLEDRCMEEHESYEDPPEGAGCESMWGELAEESEDEKG